MRIWTFGGSTTEYPWPTWADIIVKQATTDGHQAENWGRCGASNEFIVERIMECHAKNKFGPDDVVLVCLVPFFRESWFLTGLGWHLPGRATDKQVTVRDKTYNVDAVHYAMKNCAAIASIKLALAGINTVFFFDTDLYKADADLAKSKTLNFDTVLKTYEDLIKPDVESIEGIVFRKTKFESYWGDKDTPNADIHPMPGDYLKYVDNVLSCKLPWLIINEDTRSWVSNWDKQLLNSQPINLAKTGWRVTNNNQWG